MTKKEFLQNLLKEVSKLALECEDKIDLYLQWQNGSLWEPFSGDNILTLEDILELFADPIYTEIWKELFPRDEEGWNQSEEIIALVLGINPIEVKEQRARNILTKEMYYSKLRPFQCLEA